VYYADQLQILVRWDSGRSQSLKPGVDRSFIIEVASRDFSGGARLPIAKRGLVSAWACIGIGIGGFVTVSVLVGLAIARALGAIANELAQLFEADRWTMAPMMREMQRLGEQESEFAKRLRDRHSRSSQR
jgi:hypothetical protein